MSTEPFIGEVKIFGFHYAPRGYSVCDGQLLAISSNTALFSLLGTNFGGDGRTTFALPDLRGRMPIGQHAGPGLPNYNIGQKGGANQTFLNQDQLPAHSHSAMPISVNLPVSSKVAEESVPMGNYLAVTSSETYFSQADGVAGNLTVSGDTGVTGNNSPVDIMNPYLAMNYSIALQGIFPPRP